MSVELEERVRDALHQRAGMIEVARPNPEAVFERVRSRRVHRITMRAVLATVAVALVGFTALQRGGSTSVQTGHAGPPAASATLGQPAFVALPGWKVNFIAIVDSYTEYQFANGDQTLQVSFYDQGSRTGNKTNPTEVRLRGTDGVTTDEGAPRYRVDWDEQGRTWEADGSPFASVDGFLSVLEGLTVVDQNAWTASLPTGVGASILANTDKGVTWYDDTGLSCFDSQNSVPCR